ncbi:hypothetical protein GH714_016922 [Hevea brasiliensis]|uniref:Cupin type-1 domain-containing protein n=1 Tax=Hevea brasiliensis TaxID=3981 RepID=A0A6A6MEU1_HEVBR|nr:hypothetical protein GH714_016922 [Hevea brasiliensis]
MADHSPLQDFCVADPSNAVVVNGLACKDPKQVQASDFFFSGLHLTGDTSNPWVQRNRLITKVVNKGDVFVFPVGLIHFQRNVGYGKAVAIAGSAAKTLVSSPLPMRCLGRSLTFPVIFLPRLSKLITMLFLKSKLSSKQSSR